MTVVRAVRQACERGDAQTLHALLEPGVEALVDTGGDLIAPTRPVSGVEAVADTMLATLAGCELAEQQVNGEAALVARRGDRVVGIVSLAVRDDLVTTVWITLSPLKLQRWNT